MTASDVSSLLLNVSTVAVAFVAALYAARAANAAKAQTAIQKQVREDAAQPYVWVDIRPDDESGGTFVLYLGNSGPTVATDIRVTFDPSLPLGDTGSTAEAVDQLAKGISSLPPGRTMQWSLGVVNARINELTHPTGYVSRVVARGPFGELPVLQYAITLQDVRYNVVKPPGTMRGIAKSLDSLAKVVKEAARR